MQTSRLSFKYFNSFQTKFKTPTKKNIRSFHQKRLLLNNKDTRVMTKTIYIQEYQKTPFISDNTLPDETLSTVVNPKADTVTTSTSAIDVVVHTKFSTLCSQIIPF